MQIRLRLLFSSFIYTAISCYIFNSNHLIASDKPNVVLIICDDLNDWVSNIGGQEGHPQTVTPNISRFAKSATTFPLAYSNNPVCAPSRSSMMYGLYYQTSGCYFWEEWYERSEVAKKSFTLNRFFKENGYRTIGSGKVNHHMWAGYRNKNSTESKENSALEWTHYEHLTDYGPYWGTSGNTLSALPDVPSPFREIGNIDGSYGSLESPWDSPNRKSGERFLCGGIPYWGAPFHYVSEENRDPTPDERNAAWAVNQIKQLESSKEPFFLAVGFVRPHTPLHAPQKYFDLFPLEKDGIIDQVLVTQLVDNDINDTYMHGLVTARNKDRNKGPRYYQTLLESYDQNKLHALRVYTQAYLACVAAVDDSIGTVIDALENSALSESTILVITSDHGFNVGEKEWLFKASPWEESCRVPLLIRAPSLSIPGSKVTNIPVSLIDLYPTLVDLCGLPTDNRMDSGGAFLDGYSLRTLIENPESEVWDGPDAALTLIHDPKTSNKKGKHHYSIRSKNYRYIFYNNGKEELYDHRNDPYEWKNLAASQSKVSKMHREILLNMIQDISKNRNRFISR